MSVEFESSGSDSSGEDEFRHSIDSKVVVDAWQNERFKPLQGGWKMPFVDVGVPYFSDISGSRKIDFETDEMDGEVVPLVTLKHGWEFVDEWEIDMSGTFGEVDSEGWSYATSFENLFEQSKKKSLKGEMGRLSLVRRRRWVRVKQCSNDLTKVDFKEQKAWNDQLSRRLGEILDEKEKEYNLYVEHHNNRQDQVDVTIRYSKEGMDEAIAVLSHIVRNLKLIKEFLVERGEIEAQHAARLERFAEKWVDAGGRPKQLPGLEEETPEDFGFFKCMCTADTLASSRMTSFSYMLLESLPQDVDSVLDEAQSLLHDCVSDEICTKLTIADNDLKSKFSAYKAAIHTARVASAAERGRLQNTLHSASAADVHLNAIEVENEGRSSRGLSRVSIGSDRERSSTGGGAEAGMVSYASTVQRSDVYVSLREYRQAVLKADSLITQFSAFTKQQRKAIRVLGIRIQALLQAMVKMFSHEFKRLYEDTSADLSRLLGSVEQAQQLQRRLSQHGESVAASSISLQSRNAERSPSGIRYHGEEKEEVLELSNPRFASIPVSTVVARKGILRIALTKTEKVSTPLTPPPERTRSISFSPVDIMQTASAVAGVSSPYSATGLPQSPELGKWTPVVPGVDSKDCQWLNAMVVVTYDASLLIFTPTESGDCITEEVLKYGDPWAKISLAGATAHPLLLQEGDAFCVRTKFAAYALMVKEGEGPEKVMQWIRLCMNPVADPAKEPPIP